MAFTFKYWMVTTELEQMSRYPDIVHSMLDDHKQKLSDSLDEIAKDMTEEEKSGFYEYNSDEYWELADEFPRQLYSSFVVAWYSFIENQLNKLCERLKLKITIAIQDRTYFFPRYTVISAWRNFCFKVIACYSAAERAHAVDAVSPPL
jgi:hypothetical protein